MLLLSAQNLRKYYGPQPVLTGVTFDVRAGEKIGLVGPNGTGKSTLMKILAGLEEADGGNLDCATAVRIGYLDQQPHFAPGRTVWDEALDALADVQHMVQEVEQLAEQISAASDESIHRRLGDRFEKLQHALQLRGGYHLDRQIEQVLLGLGFAVACHRQPVDQLSGGQQNRLLLAKLLLAEPDVMLLDEPSNHLDIDATEWLEDFLQQSRCAVLVVSHDRYLLDAYSHLVRQGLAIDHRSGNIESVANKARSAVNKPTAAADKAARPKRRFPYRKAPEIEAEIHEREERVATLHVTLATPEVLRDGARVRQIKRELDEQQQAIARLYEHWEEAIELNS